VAKGVLPKSAIMVFGGVPKAGKSFIGLNMCRNLVLGEPLFGHKELLVNSTTVLLVEQEVGELGLFERCAPLFSDLDQTGLGAINERFFYCSQQRALDVTTEEGQQMFYELVSFYKPGVLVLDPIGKLFHGDENRNDEVGRLFDFLDDMIAFGKDWGLSIVIVHHFKKPPVNDFSRKGFDTLDPMNFRGSSRWYADPDSLLTVDRQENYPTPWKAWKLHGRFELRHGPGFDGFAMSINRNNDSRVLWEGDISPKEPQGIPDLKMSGFGGGPKQDDDGGGDKPGLRTFKRI